MWVALLEFSNSRVLQLQRNLAMETNPSLITHGIATVWGRSLDNDVLLTVYQQKFANGIQQMLARKLSRNCSNEIVTELVINFATEHNIYKLNFIEQHVYTLYYAPYISIYLYILFEFLVKKHKFRLPQE